MSDKERQLRPLILDLGSDTFRLGWAGDDSPSVVVPAVYVDIRDYIFESNVIDGLDDLFYRDKEERQLFGENALNYQNILKVHEFNVESNITMLQKFFLHYYKRLEIVPEFLNKQPIIIISPFFMTELIKTKLQQVFFDNLNFPYIFFLPESQSIMETLQKRTGVVVNMGDLHTYISSIFQGFTNIMARDVFPVTGKDLTNYLINLILIKKGKSLNLYLDKWLAKEIKEKAALCVTNPEQEIESIKQGYTNYDQLINFPDGTSLDINAERFLLSEPYFDPRIIHIDYMGLPEAISKVIKVWDRENWEELIPNIILSGGGSLISGFKEKLKVKIKQYFSDKINHKVNVIAASGRENMGWLGASILYSKNHLQEGWIPNPEYNG
jgi:actin-related protein